MRTPSLTAGPFGASAAQMYAFSSDQIVTRRAGLTAETLLFCLILLVIYIPDETRKHRNFDFIVCGDGLS